MRHLSRTSSAEGRPGTKQHKTYRHLYNYEELIGFRGENGRRQSFQNLRSHMFFSSIDSTMDNSNIQSLSCCVRFVADSVQVEGCMPVVENPGRTANSTQ